MSPFVENGREKAFGYARLVDCIVLKVGGGWAYNEHEMLAGLCVMTLLFPCS